MTRTALPYSAPDLSALARLLERALADHQATHGRLPGHVEMMNLLARGAGRRNLQELKAAAARDGVDATSSSTSPPREAPTSPTTPTSPSTRTATSARPASIPVPASASPRADDAPVDLWFDAPELLDPVASPMPWLHLSEHATKAMKCFDTAGRLARWPLKLSVQRLAMWVLWTRFDARRVYTEDDVNRVLKAWHVYGDHATLRRELVNHKLMTRKSDCSEYRKIVQWPDDEVRALLVALRRRQAPLVRLSVPTSTMSPASTPEA